MKKFTNVNEQLSTELEIESRIDETITLAQKAFWDVVADKFPELTLEQSETFDGYLSQAIKECVYTNHPELKK